MERRKLEAVFCVLTFVMVSSCSSFSKQRKDEKLVNTEIGGLEKESGSLNASMRPAALVLKDDIVPLNKKNDTPLSHYSRLDLVQNSYVDEWIEYFAERDRPRFIRFLSRGETYRQLVQAILREEGLPEELFYLALIESGYTVHAQSSAKAKGVWQFMPATAKRYGLKIDQFVDERVDPIRATRAASHYLKDLYNVFGSWPLAMSAYNAGEGRIMGALFRGKTRNYWELVDKKVLPDETANYVPKFMAAIHISKNRKDLIGVTHVDPALVLPSIGRLEVPTPLLMTDLANLLGMSTSDLWKLNPHLKKNTTPPSSSGRYVVWIPKQYLTKANPAQLAELSQRARTLVSKQSTLRFASNPSYSAPTSSSSQRKVASVNRISFKKYKVRNGDNLFSIADRFEVSVNEIKRANGLRRNNIFIGESLKVPMSKSM